jgi:hypothetical protein
LASFSLLETKPKGPPVPADQPCRILAVWTRALDGVDGAGRVNVARSVRAALTPLGPLNETRLQNALERRRLAGAGRTAWALLRGLLSGRPLPLQCAIFADPRSMADAAAAAASSDVIYLDGVRTLPLLRHLRRRRPDAQIVVDADDLMSRRYNELIDQKLPLSLGYLEARVPGPVARIVRSRAVARLVLGYERLALRHAERELLALADRVVLLNRAEAAMLRAEADRLRMPPRATVLAIPPVVGSAARGRASWSSPGAPLRAVFIGTDALTQNRLTIDFLLDLWQRERFSMPLVIYGRQRRPGRCVPNVTWAGYVKDVSEVYAPGSVLVTPSFLRGGIKTKVLEAFAHGVPVVGNSVTFEGLDLPDYPLCLDGLDALAAFLRAPSSHSGAIARALKMEEECLRRDHAGPVFAARWAEAVLGWRGSDPPSEPRARDELQDGAALSPRSRARATFGFNDNSSNAGFAPAAGE